MSVQSSDKQNVSVRAFRGGEFAKCRVSNIKFRFAESNRQATGTHASGVPRMRDRLIESTPDACVPLALPLIESICYSPIRLFLLNSPDV